MLKVNDVKVTFRGDLDASYKDGLDRLFFFNKKQHQYRDRINKSIEDYSMPVLKEFDGRVAIKFREEWMGQTLHVMDDETEDAELVGVIVYARDSMERVTVVHFVLHEHCHRIFKESSVNVAVIIFQQLFQVLRKLQGVNSVRVYYTDKVFPLAKSEYTE